MGNIFQSNEALTKSRHLAHINFCWLKYGVMDT